MPQPEADTDTPDDPAPPIAAEPPISSAAATAWWGHRAVRAVFAALAAIAVAAAACGVAALATIHHQPAPYGAPPRSCGWIDTGPLRKANPGAGPVSMDAPDRAADSWDMDTMATLDCTAESSSGQARAGMDVIVARYPSDRQAAFADAQLRGHKPRNEADLQSVPDGGLLIYNGLDMEAVTAHGPVTELHGVGGHDAWCIRGSADPWKPAEWTEVGIRDHNLLLLVWVQLAVPGQPTDPAARLWAATHIAHASLPRLHHT